MPSPLHVRFVAGSSGLWRIDTIQSVTGSALPVAENLTVFEGNNSETQTTCTWVLRGVTSNTRYTKKKEAAALFKKQAGLARTEATCAALIPIRKTSDWWNLSQDERRAVFEEQSRHIKIGLDYLPAVARRLHHCRELSEPFDFLTWFEYAPQHACDFEKMVDRLRSTPEWRYVDREVDIRLSRSIDWIM